MVKPDSYGRTVPASVNSFRFVGFKHNQIFNIGVTHFRGYNSTAIQTAKDLIREERSN